ncbi:hypothetical protein ACQ4LE_007417 [Meloidogyne hapla]
MAKNRRRYFKSTKQFWFTCTSSRRTNWFFNILKLNVFFLSGIQGEILARAQLATGACTKCGYVGHLPFQCRNFIQIKPNQKTDIDISSTSSEEYTTPLTSKEGLYFLIYIKIITNKATRIYYTLIRSLKTNNIQFLITLYKIYVLPILEFGSPIINPYLQKDINAIENVQNRFLKIIYLRSGKHKNSQTIPNYPELLKLFKLEPLSHRRLKSNLTLFHNIISGRTQLTHDNTFSILPTNTRGNPHNLFIPFCSSTIRKNSFFISIPNIYKNLPIDLQKSPTYLFPKLLNNVNIANILKQSPNQLSPDHKNQNQ